MMKTLQEATMQCDLDTGICEVPQANASTPASTETKPVKLLYFTDPICSSCWGIEPQLRKLKQEYGAYFHVEYRMGGLLKNWDEYGGTDVNGPASVAQHWEEASAFYNMPIDGDVWIESPLHSSYPPSIAFKAAQMQDSKKANRYLRRLKEMVFMEKTNITLAGPLLRAAREVGLNAGQLEHDMVNDARDLFEADLQMAKEWGVRGFPTIYFIDGDDNRFKVYGSKHYQVYEEALLKLLPAAFKKEAPSSYDSIFKNYDTVTLKEFAVFFDKLPSEAEAILSALEEEKKLKRMVTKAGIFWKVTDQNVG